MSYFLQIPIFEVNFLKKFFLKNPKYLSQITILGSFSRLCQAAAEIAEIANVSKLSQSWLKYELLSQKRIAYRYPVPIWNSALEFIIGAQMIDQLTLLG